MFRTLILVVLVTSAFSATGTYDYLKGSTDWGSLGSCSGTENSPINVLPNTALNTENLGGKAFGKSSATVKVKQEYNDKTVILKPKTEGTKLFTSSLFTLDSTKTALDFNCI